MATEKLIEFALFVLERMEKDHDWNGDTLDSICIKADDLGLAESDDEGMFKRTKAGKE